MANQNLQVHIHNPAIACDFCEAPITAEMEQRAAPPRGFSWGEQQVGPCLLRYVRCSACGVDNLERPIGFLGRVQAGITRARRHSPEYAEALDKFVAGLIWHSDVEREVAHG